MKRNHYELKEISEEKKYKKDLCEKGTFFITIRIYLFIELFYAKSQFGSSRADKNSLN
jgi:hypothetical protein